MKWTGFILIDILIALVLISVWLEVKGNYFSIIMQRPVNTEWFGIVPEHPNPPPVLVTRIRGPFPLPAGLADYAIISVAEGNIILRGQKVSSAYQSLSFYPNTYLRLGSASPSILDFENIITDEDGNYEIHLSAEKQDYMENWFHLNGQKGGMIALRSYRPPYGEKLIYPSVELNGKIIQEEQVLIFNNPKIEI